MDEAPPWVPTTRRSAMFAVVALILASAIPSFTAAAWLSGQGIEKRADAQVGTCERATQDRIDSARGWTEAAVTERERSLDPAVVLSEQRRAAGRSIIYGETANALRSRLFLCGPLIRDGEKIIDEAALSEAQGEL